MYTIQWHLKYYPSTTPLSTRTVHDLRRKLHETKKSQLCPFFALSSRSLSLICFLSPWIDLFRVCHICEGICLSYCLLVAGTKCLTPKMKEGKFYFLQFLEGSVYMQLVLKQGGMVGLLFMATENSKAWTFFLPLHFMLAPPLSGCSTFTTNLSTRQQTNNKC